MPTSPEAIAELRYTEISSIQLATVVELITDLPQVIDDWQATYPSLTRLDWSVVLEDQPVQGESLPKITILRNSHKPHHKVLSFSATVDLGLVHDFFPNSTSSMIPITNWNFDTSPALATLRSLIVDYFALNGWMVTEATVSTLAKIRMTDSETDLRVPVSHHLSFTLQPSFKPL